jgi:hypothetical protein
MRQQLILTFTSILGEESSSLIGTLEINNTEDHTRSPEYENYRAILRHNDNTSIKIRIRDWDQSRDTWELVEDTLRAIRESKERKTYTENKPIPPSEDFPETLKKMFGI